MKVDIEIESRCGKCCAGITVFNPLVQFNVSPGARVGAVSIGGLGHLALQFYNAWGCEVVAFTSSEAKTAEALELGAHRTLNSRDADSIGSAAGNLDLILRTVSADLDWSIYLSTLRPKGRLHFVGVVLQPLDIRVLQLMSGQLSVSSSPVGSPATISRHIPSSTASMRLTTRWHILTAARRDTGLY